MIYVLIVSIFTIILQLFVILKYRKIVANNKLVVASVTHDLKNPIKAQINMLNLLLKGDFGVLNTKQYEMLSLTSNASNYMFELVNTILSGYECESANFHLNKSEFDIVELVKNVCNDNMPLSRQKGQSVILNYSLQKCFIYADKLQIERVISNLLSNAIAYGTEGSTITINLIKNENLVDFSISNHSFYISRRELKEIFGKFTKTKMGESAKTSSGFGLYVAKKIIDMHNGKIYAKSTKEGICTFGFCLKLNKIGEIQNV